jgi:hypothetical protein
MRDLPEIVSTMPRDYLEEHFIKAVKLVEETSRHVPNTTKAQRLTIEVAELFSTHIRNLR